MGAILGSLAQNLIEVIFFVLIAWAGIVLGKKFRDKKDAKAAIEMTEKKDTK